MLCCVVEYIVGRDIPSFLTDGSYHMWGEEVRDL